MDRLSIGVSIQLQLSIITERRQSDDLVINPTQIRQYQLCNGYILFSSQAYHVYHILLMYLLISIRLAYIITFMLKLMHLEIEAFIYNYIYNLGFISL